jgi:hypothetical protein
MLFALAASLVPGCRRGVCLRAIARSTQLLAAELTADHPNAHVINNVLGTHQEPQAVESSMASASAGRCTSPNSRSAGLNC